ncbi:MAG: lysozyme [Pseudomonadota bacterium]|nr:lysozyme [Pseudomonadota bacterium]
MHTLQTSIQAGLPTIGYGHLIQSGEDFSEGISEIEAEDLLKRDVQVATDAVRTHVSVPLNQNQFDALVSFGYNVGAKNFEDSTLIKRLNNGAYDEAASEFKRWNKITVDGKKVVSRGLIKRRAREEALFRKEP